MNSITRPKQSLGEPYLQPGAHDELTFVHPLLVGFSVPPVCSAELRIPTWNRQLVTKLYTVFFGWLILTVSIRHLLRVLFGVTELANSEPNSGDREHSLRLSETLTELIEGHAVDDQHPVFTVFGLHRIGQRLEPSRLSRLKESLFSREVELTVVISVLPSILPSANSRLLPGPFLALVSCRTRVWEPTSKIGSVVQAPLPRTSPVTGV